MNQSTAQLDAKLADLAARKQQRLEPNDTTSKQAALTAVRLHADAYAASLGYRVRIVGMVLEPLE